MSRLAGTEKKVYGWSPPLKVGFSWGALTSACSVLSLPLWLSCFPKPRVVFFKNEHKQISYWMCSWPLRWTTWLMPRASLLPKRKKKKRRRERSWPGNPLSLECHPHWWEKGLVLIPWPFWLNWTRVTLLQYFGSSRSSQPLLYSLCRDVAFPPPVQEVRGHPLGREAIETQGRDGVGGHAASEENTTPSQKLLLSHYFYTLGVLGRQHKVLHSTPQLCS